jgi:hypothetical protein
MNANGRRNKTTVEQIEQKHRKTDKLMLIKLERQFLKMCVYKVQ